MLLTSCPLASTNWILANGQLSSFSYYYLPWIPDIFLRFATEWLSVCHTWTDLQPKPKAISSGARAIPFTIPVELWSFLLYCIYFEPHCDLMDWHLKSCQKSVLNYRQTNSNDVKYNFHMYITKSNNKVFGAQFQNKGINRINKNH